jgi:hypothetical protein
MDDRHAGRNEENGKLWKGAGGEMKEFAAKSGAGPLLLFQEMKGARA